MALGSGAAKPATGLRLNVVPGGRLVKDTVWYRGIYAPVAWARLHELRETDMFPQQEVNSIEQMRAADSVLLLVDIQQRLAPALHEVESLVRNVAKLIEGTRRLKVPLVATEHCASSIGQTLPDLRAQLTEDEIYGKRHFDACDEEAFRGRVSQIARRQWVLCGAEAHVCLLQTALGLRRLGAAVFVVADAAGSRTEANSRLGMERLRAAGCVIVSTEMVLFEWLQHADNPAFKEVLALIKQANDGL